MLWRQRKNRLTSFQPPQQVESFKYLGTELDTWLSFSQHTNSLYKRAQQRLHLLRKLGTFHITIHSLNQFQHFFLVQLPHHQQNRIFPYNQSGQQNNWFLASLPLWALRSICDHESHLIRRPLSLPPSLYSHCHQGDITEVHLRSNNHLEQSQIQTAYTCFYQLFLNVFSWKLYLLPFSHVKRISVHIGTDNEVYPI